MIGDIIPITRIYKDGVFAHEGNLYSMCLKFNDINYFIASNEEKQKIFLNYEDLLNSLDTSIFAKITITNKKIDIAEIQDNIVIP